MPQPRRLPLIWSAALFLAWTADQLFWGHPPGLSFPLWTLVAVGALFLSARWGGNRPAWTSYLLAAATIGLSLTLVLRNEPFSRGLSALLALSGLGLLAATLLNGNWIAYRIGDYLVAGARLFAAAVVRGSGGTVGPKPAAPEGAGPTETSAPRTGPSVWRNVRRSFPYLRGLLLALPVLLVLGALLSSADPVFAGYMKDFFRIFDLEKLPEYLFRLFYILVFAYIFAGLLLHAALPESAEKRPDPNQPWNTRFLGSTESFIILGLVLALFAFFIAVQFRYLFGGQANIRETGFTYSEYARRGFFELVWVAVLSLGLYLTLSAVTRRDPPAVRRAFSYLSMALFALVLLLLASALQRLMLYEAAYGFTRLRTYTHILIPWLGLLLLAAVVLEGLRRPGRIGLAFLFFAFGFGLTFTTINVDALIAGLNLRRAQAGGDLDSSHLSSLSSDAVPVLARAFNAEKDPVRRDRIGSALACHWIYTAAEAGYRPDWRSYNHSSAQAVQILTSLDLSGYLTKNADSRSGWSVYQDWGTQNGVDLCLDSSWD